MSASSSSSLSTTSPRSEASSSSSNFVSPRSGSFPIEHKVDLLSDSPPRSGSATTFNSTPKDEMSRSPPLSTATMRLVPQLGKKCVKQPVEFNKVYQPSDMVDIAEDLLNGAAHLYYGAGGTGKTYEVQRLTEYLKSKGMQCMLTTYANATATNLGQEAKGIYEMLAFTVDPITRAPSSKLDQICRAVRRCNPTRRFDHEYDGKEASGDDIKLNQYMKYNLKSLVIHNASDADIIATIDTTTARYKHKDAGVAYKRMINAKVIAIEELFMVSDVLLEAMDTTLRKYRRRDVPFGGLGFLGSGDVLQTMPVQGDFLFQSQLWSKLSPKVHLFNEFKRFNDPVWAAALSEIRLGILSRETDLMLRSCIPSEVEASDST